MRAHEQVPAPFLDLFCEWLGVTRLSLDFLMDLHRNRRDWTEVTPGSWVFHGASTREASSEVVATDPGFAVTRELDGRPEPAYITVGRGYPD